MLSLPWPFLVPAQDEENAARFRSLHCHEQVQGGMLRTPFIVGGFGTRKEIDNEQVIKFIQRFAPPLARSSESTPHLLTVCTGSALAARAGVLDGRSLPCPA